jgi:ABC-2 type transport system permease protein
MTELTYAATNPLRAALRKLPFSPGITAATTTRILQQLVRDPGSIALMLGIPCMLFAILKAIFRSDPEAFTRVGPQMFGVFPLIVMYLVASVSTLRERVTGTAERLLTLTVRRMDLILGYTGAFGTVALVQAVLSTVLALGPLNLQVKGPSWLLMLVAVAGALLGVALGLLVSAFARNEFQAVQFLPAAVLPQFLMCGLFVPRDDMHGAFTLLSKMMPMTYAVQAADEVAKRDGITGVFVRDVTLIGVSILVVLGLSARTLRR